MSQHRANYSALNDIDAAIAAVKAFSQMVTKLLESRDDHSDIAYGVQVLLDTQCAILGENADAVRHQYSAMDAHLKDDRPATSKSLADPRALRAAFITERASEGYGAGEIANALNLKRTTVERVISRLLGEDDTEAGSGKLAVNE